MVIAVAYDCVDKMVYWSDITGPAISRASLSGGDISHIITKGLSGSRSSKGGLVIRWGPDPKDHLSSPVLRYGKS